MCDKAVDDYADVLDFVPDQYKTQEMCDKAVDDCHTLEFVSDQYRSSKMCDKIVSDNSFKLKYCNDRYKTQEICDKIVDDFLPALKFVSDWFVASKLIKKLYTALFADDGILCSDEYSGNVTFCSEEMDILIANLYNISLVYINYDEDDTDTIIHVRRWLGTLNLENVKHLRKS